MELVEVAAGWYWMGSNEGPPGDGPRHRVWLDGFAIGRTPVTNAEYAPFLESTRTLPPPWWNDARFADPGQPVVGVNWFEATAYCGWLSGERRDCFQLPTEAQWEKAARGGLDDARFPWGADRPARTLDRPPLVLDTPANPWGLLGLSGACHEWCLDWEDERYYSRSPDRNPLGPAQGTRRVSRGGAWRHQDPWTTVARRSSLPPSLRYSDYGFRVVRALS